ncbi:hypothetical protein Glove_519g100 [Diversispora epigaea]|uniref:Uncharacterized protein n=1 Tax=Diversispora epigaea TaxID=1348612 RepID=A0A397GJG6_9GLOM|nr:hypothetical protein Glove_519g100 [Diversispora epigaea]
MEVKKKRQVRRIERKTICLQLQCYRNKGEKESEKKGKLGNPYTRNRSKGKKASEEKISHISRNYSSTEVRKKKEKAMYPQLQLHRNKKEGK